MSTDEHTWELFVAEQAVEVAAGGYPSEEQVVEFAVWLTRRRERVCLAPRADSGPRLIGLVKRTIRNMLTELFDHAWPRRWAAFAELGKKQRAAYEDAILRQVDGLRAQAALSVDSNVYGPRASAPMVCTCT